MVIGFGLAGTDDALNGFRRVTTLVQTSNQGTAASFTCIISNESTRPLQVILQERITFGDVLGLT